MIRAETLWPSNRAKNSSRLTGLTSRIFDGEWLINHHGKAIAHFNQGWFRDLRGDCVAFMEGASGGPMTPHTKFAPIPPSPGITPMATVASLSPIPPMPSVNWSVSGWDGLQKQL